MTQLPQIPSDKQGSQYFIANGPSGLNFTIFVTTSERDPIFVTMTDTSTRNQTTAQVNARQVLTFTVESDTITSELMYLTYSIIITSASENLYVFVQYTQLHPSDGFLAIPKSTDPPKGDHDMDYQYIVVGEVPAISLTATANCTLVSISSVSNESSLNGMRAHKEHVKFLLQQGETMVILDHNSYSNIIYSSKFLSVLAGAECDSWSGFGSALFPHECSPEFYIEQLPPIHEWGKQFAITPIGERKDGAMSILNQVRVISSQNSVVVTINCSSTRNESTIQTTLSKGHWYQHKLVGDFYCWIEGNGSISVVQYFRTNRMHSMTIVPSLQQYTNHYALPSMQSRVHGSDYINIYIPVQYFQPDEIFLDGASLEEHGLQFKPIRDNSGEVAVYTTTANFSDRRQLFHSLSHSTDEAEFGVVMHGSKYAYPGGLHHGRGEGKYISRM
jgi:hypothetical protein